MTKNQSKINLLNAQINQFESSGLFDDAEKLKLCAPLKLELEVLVNEIGIKD